MTMNFTSYSNKNFFKRSLCKQMIQLVKCRGTRLLARRINHAHPVFFLNPRDCAYTSTGVFNVKTHFQGILTYLRLAISSAISSPRNGTLPSLPRRRNEERDFCTMRIASMSSLQCNLLVSINICNRAMRNKCHSDSCNSFIGQNFPFSSASETSDRKQESTITPEAASVLNSIKIALDSSMKKSVDMQRNMHNTEQENSIIRSNTAAKTNRRHLQLSKKEKRAIQGNIARYQLMGNRPEFHNIDRNINHHIIEPTDLFQIRITTSKNNVHAQVLNMSNGYRTVFGSYAGNVGIRKSEQQSNECAYRIGENIARKCKRLGIFSVSVIFRRISRVDSVLKALNAHNLNISTITHEPRLPMCGLHARKARKRRRV